MRNYAKYAKVTKMNNPLKKQVKKIGQNCLEGRLGVAQAISEIDQAIGGITKVVYQPGLKFNITNHSGVYSLGTNACGKKQTKRLEGLAVVGYFRAKENGSRTPGEVHASKQASTKDHMDGIYQILEKYAA